jgi:hypothetical protein
VIMRLVGMDRIGQTRQLPGHVLKEQQHLIVVPRKIRGVLIAGERKKM